MNFGEWVLMQQSAKGASPEVVSIVREVLRDWKEERESLVSLMVQKRLEGATAGSNHLKEHFLILPSLLNEVIPFSVTFPSLDSPEYIEDSAAYVKGKKGEWVPAIQDNKPSGGRMHFRDGTRLTPELFNVYRRLYKAVIVTKHPSQIRGIFKSLLSKEERDECIFSFKSVEGGNLCSSRSFSAFTRSELAL